MYNLCNHLYLFYMRVITFVLCVMNTYVSKCIYTLIYKFKFLVLEYNLIFDYDIGKKKKNKTKRIEKSNYTL